MFNENQPANVDEVELASNDRVAAMDDDGKMRKARVATVLDGTVGVTFHNGDSVHMRNRSEVLPLYRYNANQTVALPFVMLPAAK